MPKTRKQKEESVESLTKSLKDATNVTFANFSKLKVIDERALRRNLRESGSSYTVIKKTLFARALKALGFDLPEYDGQIAIAYGSDAIAPAKSISEFVKKHEGMMSILGGIFEGKLVDAVKMKEIATIPDRKSLLSMLANVLQSPMQRLAIGLSEIAKKK